MNTLAERLKTERTHKQLTQKELGDLVGVDRSSICQWETGFVTNIYSGNLVKVAAALGVNPDWLETGRGCKFFNKKGVIDGIKEERRVRSSVPVLTHEQVRNKEYLSEKWLNCPVEHSDKTYALPVDSDSMVCPLGAKSYPEGSYIFVDNDKPLQSGCRVIAKLTGGSIVFREYREDVNKFLRPLNPNYSVIEINEDVEIIGVVIGSFVPE